MTIRILHHWACSGGTMLSRIIASLPRVVLLSEVHPLAHLRLEVPGVDYIPTDLIQQLCLPHNGRDPVLCAAAWNGAIDALQAALQSDHQHLVLRSHSHIDFFTGASCTDEAFVSRSLAPRHRLLELVSVRHPLDSWISIQAQDWHRHYRLPSLAEFCRRGLLMLQACRSLPLLRYEQLCLQPQAALEQICSLLELPSPSDALIDSSLKVISLSGDSGRRGYQIAPRPRRPIPAAVEQELVAELLRQETTSTYRQLCDKLGYDPDPGAHHPFTMAAWSPNTALLFHLMMTSSTDPTSLENGLLRSEQRYFEQLNAQATQLEEAIERERDLEAKKAEAIATCATLKASLQQRDAELTQLQSELQQAKQLASLQLKQAQEELAVCLDLQNYLTSWSNQLKRSPRSQIKLLAKTILVQITDKLRWALPIRILRHHKAVLRQLLIRQW